MSVLVTGNQSGLGKYLFDEMGDYGIDKTTSGREDIIKQGAEVIVHCAFNQARDIDTRLLTEYVEDNILLTRELVKAPHRVFVYISSVDVYPKDGRVHQEDEPIRIDTACGLYAVSKLISEAIIRRFCPQYLILRCSALLGRDMRKNSLLRIAFEEDCPLSLRGDSICNYVLHQDIGEFIRYALKHHLSGTYNAVASENITLGEVADMLGKKIRFGEYRYEVGDPDNRKIVNLFSAFNRTSRENIEIFMGAVS